MVAGAIKVEEVPETKEVPDSHLPIAINRGLEPYTNSHLPIVVEAPKTVPSFIILGIDLLSRPERAPAYGTATWGRKWA